MGTIAGFLMPMLRVVIIDMALRLQTTREKGTRIKYQIFSWQPFHCAVLWPPMNITEPRKNHADAS
jgi:hypothetical protein